MLDVMLGIVDRKDQDQDWLVPGETFLVELRS